MATQYFVIYHLHNAKNDGWAYAIVNKFSDLVAAKESYHSTIAQYLHSSDFDIVTVMITDMFGNNLESDFTDRRVAPEPEITEG